MHDPNALRTRYERITDLLTKARRAIPVTHIVASEADSDITRPGVSRGGQDEFERYMGVGNYEYAWLALFSTAEIHPPREQFWSLIAEAAYLLVDQAKQQSYPKKVENHMRENAAFRHAFEALARTLKDPHERDEAAAYVRVLDGV